MKAWHFCRNDRRLGFNDGRVIRTGRLYRISGKPIMCRHGLHASRRIIDALEYAEGHIICRVTLSGTIISGTNKIVATERRVIWSLNAEKILHEFACRCGERALHKASIKDPALATNEELTAARNAAWAAAPAATTASKAAKWAAEAAAAGTTTAATAAVKNAAWAAAARDNSRTAELDWQNRVLLRLVREARL
jgi:hypothetical protein